MDSLIISFLLFKSSFHILFSCDDSANSKKNNEIVVAYSGQKIICENCSKIIKEKMII